MLWVMNYLMIIFALLGPMIGILFGWRYAAQLWREGWGSTPRSTMLASYGGGVFIWLMFGLMSPSGLFYWSFLGSLVAIFVPSFVVIATRPDTPEVTDSKV